MTFFILWCLAGLVVGIVFASFFEWTLHKYVMHRPVGKFRYAFQAHAIVHHGTFKADKSYHLIYKTIEENTKAFADSIEDYKVQIKLLMKEIKAN